MLPQFQPPRDVCNGLRTALEQKQADVERCCRANDGDAPSARPGPRLWVNLLGTRQLQRNWFPRRFRGTWDKFPCGEGTPRVLRERVHKSPLRTQVLQIDRALTTDTSGATRSVGR